MATLRWQGDAAAVAQVTTVQITGFDASTAYRLTINGKVISVAGTTDAAGTATALAAAWNASAEPEVAEVTASAATDTVTLTADVKGKPFTVTSSASGGTGTIGSATIATANAGPNVASAGENWSGGAAPADGDTVVFDTGSAPLRYDLGQSSVDLAGLTVTADYTGQIGLPETAGTATGSTTTTNAGTYAEYRGTYYQVGVSGTVTIGGGGDGGGPRLVKLDLGSADAATVNVLGTGQRMTGEPAAVILKGTNAANVLNVTKGSVAVAPFAGETATFATVRVGYQTDPNGDASVRLGSGVALTDVDVSGGTVEIASGTTTLDVTGGAVTIVGGTHAALNVDGGTVYYSGTGTVTTLKVSDGGTVDFGRDMRPVTVTNCELYGGGTIRDPFRRVTWTNGVDLIRCGLGDVTLDLGAHVTLTPSAVS